MIRFLFIKRFFYDVIYWLREIIVYIEIFYEYGTFIFYRCNIIDYINGILILLSFVVRKVNYCDVQFIFINVNLCMEDDSFVSVDIFFVNSVVYNVIYYYGMFIEQFQIFYFLFSRYLSIQWRCNYGNWVINKVFILWN